jgi:hypothetical protein
MILKSFSKHFSIILINVYGEIIQIIIIYVQVLVMDHSNSNEQSDRIITTSADKMKLSCINKFQQNSSEFVN